MDRWRVFEQDFRAIKEDPFNFLSASFHDCIPRPKSAFPGSFGWRLNGGFATPERARFELVASEAAQVLSDFGCGIPDEVFQTTKPVDCWLNALQALTEGYKISNTTSGVDDNGNSITIMNGCIERVIEWSAVLCLKLAALDQPANVVTEEAEPSTTDPQAIPAREEIVRKFIVSATDLADRKKMKVLCTALDEAQIPIPKRRSHWQGAKKEWTYTSMCTWMQIWSNPSSKEYKWITNSRKSPLLNNIYRDKKHGGKKRRMLK